MSNGSAIGKRVLVVEDEPDFAALLRSILVKAGHRVELAHNCEDALAKARKFRPDLITLDIHMPRKSGAFFYRKLKTENKFRNIPVVVVTGLTQDAEMGNIVRCCLEAEDLPPPEAYVEKPVDGAKLLRTVQETLEFRAAKAR